MRATTTLLALIVGAAAAAAAVPAPTPLPGYVLNADLSDEFQGSELNASKWGPSPHWPGRAPGLFDPSNVVVQDGTLQLWARAARRNSSWPAGFDNYTTAAIHSLAKQQLGFFEIRWRSGSSSISSSWWLHDNNGSAWTEIDVFETTGVTNPARGGANASTLPSHVHVFELPGTPTASLPAQCGGCALSGGGAAPCSKGSSFSLPSGATFAQAFHTAQLNWTGAGVAVYLDGELVNTITSPCLVNPLGVDFDRETMPGWMSLPPPETLPDVPFAVDYIRSWVREE